MNKLLTSSILAIILSISTVTLTGCFVAQQDNSSDTQQISVDIEQQTQDLADSTAHDGQQYNQPIEKVVPEGRIGNELTGYVDLPNKWLGQHQHEWKFPIPNTAAGTYAIKPTTLTHINELNADVYMKGMSVELALFPAQDFAAALSLVHEENPAFYLEPSIEETTFKDIPGWLLKYKLPSGAIEVQNIVIPSPTDPNACFIFTTYAPKNGSYEVYENLLTWDIAQ